MKVENFIGTQFGGLGKQLINPLKASDNVTSRFVGAKGGQQQNEQRIRELLNL